MLSNRLLRRTAHSSSRGGFTLVELLVVIAIIAILAGVALGPITSGIKKAQQSGALQGTKALGLAEFTYANDNNNSYPAAGTLGAFVTLMYPTYVSDLGSLIINGSGNTKYTGATPTTGIVSSMTPATATCSYDFVTGIGNIALSASYPDGAPVVFSGANAALAAGTAAAGAPTAAVVNLNVDSTCPLGIDGMAVCYHSNSAKYIKATAGVVPVVDIGYPAGYQIVSFGSW
jgi:prepilin-type N-terminal cleavage/methylation domain-containing protein